MRDLQATAHSAPTAGETGQLVATDGAPARTAREVPSPRSGVEARLSTAGILLMSAAAATWTAVIGALAVWRHDEFLSHRYDLGNMAQAVWSTTQGRPLEVTDGATGEQVTRLASHVDPVLVLLAPFWAIYPHAETLIVVQAAALASGIYPVVRLALKHTQSQLAAGLLGAWYLAFPWLVWNAFNDFHPVAFAIPLLLYAIWFLDEHRLGRFWIVAGLVLLTGELIGLTLAGIGVWYALTHRPRRVGLAMAAVGSAWTAVCLALILPAFNEGEGSQFYRFFDDIGGSPTGLLKTLVTDPAAVFAAVTTGADGEYVLWLLLPTALLALASPVLLLAALPQLGVNLLAGYGPSTEPMYQYVSAIVPVLVAATIVAIGRMPRRRLAAALPLVAAVVCLVWRPPIPGEHGYLFAATESSVRIEAMQATVDLVPDNASVTATNRLGAHLSARRSIYLFPDRSSSDWIAIDVRDPFVVAGGGERLDGNYVRRAVVALERDPAWRLVFDRAGVRVYRRR